jgi:hypothetical protein
MYNHLTMFISRSEDYNTNRDYFRYMIYNHQTDNLSLRLFCRTNPIFRQEFLRYHTAHFRQVISPHDALYAFTDWDSTIKSIPTFKVISSFSVIFTSTPFTLYIILYIFAFVVFITYGTRYWTIRHKSIAITLTILQG